MRAPDFWGSDDPFSRLAVAALTPIGSLYGATVQWKARNTTPYRPPVPVVCIGNITAGGTGKTPTAIAVADAMISRGRTPAFLTRGYGGDLSGPIVVAKEHTASQVGDEPLLLSRKATTVVSRDRRAGARLAVDHGADVIIMDDGHQNFSIAKNLSFVVVDAETGFGNGRLLPAGPLREPVRQGLARADAVILMGSGATKLEGYSGLVLNGRVETTSEEPWKGRRIIAFAGIGRPEKFFASLRDIGAQLVEIVAFPDHHRFSAQEIASLKAKAGHLDAELVTTEKDLVRLQVADSKGIAVLPIRAVIEPAGDLERLLDSLVAPR